MKHLSKDTLVPSTTDQASLNVAPGSAVSSPESGDIWNESGALKFKTPTDIKTLATTDQLGGSSVMSVTSDTLIQAAIVTLHTGAVSYYTSVLIDVDKLLIVWSDDDVSYKGYAAVVTTIDDVVSIKTPVQIVVSAFYNPGLSILDTNKALLTTSNNTICTAYILDISGDTVSVGSGVNFESTSGYYVSTAVVSTSKAVVVYSATTNVIKACTLNISGSVVTPTASVVLLNFKCTVNSLVALSSTSLIIAYSKEVNSTIQCIEANPVTLSGDTLTAGTAVSVLKVGMYGYSFLTKLSSSTAGFITSAVTIQYGGNYTSYGCVFTVTAGVLTMSEVTPSGYGYNSQNDLGRLIMLSTTKGLIVGALYGGVSCFRTVEFKSKVYFSEFIPMPISNIGTILGGTALDSNRLVYKYVSGGISYLPIDKFNLTFEDKTQVDGILKGNGVNISKAVPGVDYATGFTALNGVVLNNGLLTLNNETDDIAITLAAKLDVPAASITLHQLLNSKTLLVYSSGSPVVTYLVVLTHNLDGSVSYGTTVNLAFGYSAYNNLTDSTGVLFYGNGSNRCAVTVTVTGTTISLGAETLINSNNGAGYLGVKFTDSKLLLGYYSSSGAFAVILDVVGEVITVGVAVQLSTHLGVVYPVVLSSDTAMAFLGDSTDMNTKKTTLNLSGSTLTIQDTSVFCGYATTARITPYGSKHIITMLLSGTVWSYVVSLGLDGTIVTEATKSIAAISGYGLSVNFVSDSLFVYVMGSNTSGLIALASIEGNTISIKKTIALSNFYSVNWINFNTTRALIGYSDVKAQYRLNLYTLDVFLSQLDKTTVTGLLKGTGEKMVPAVPGTDFPAIDHVHTKAEIEAALIGEITSHTHAGGSSSSRNIDGGSPDSIYLASQVIDGGNP